MSDKVARLNLEEVHEDLRLGQEWIIFWVGSNNQKMQLTEIAEITSTAEEAAIIDAAEMYPETASKYRLVAIPAHIAKGYKVRIRHTAIIDDE